MILEYHAQKYSMGTKGWPNVRLLMRDEGFSCELSLVATLYLSNAYLPVASSSMLAALLPITMHECTTVHRYRACHYEWQCNRSCSLLLLLCSRMVELSFIVARSVYSMATNEWPNLCSLMRDEGFPSCYSLVAV